LPTDDGFEDREGHQAPFTLRKAENVQRSEPDWHLTSNVEHRTPNAEQKKEEPADSKMRQLSAQLFNRLDLLDDGIEIRPVTGFELGMEELPIGVNFKGAAT
jgi:hypothetical protein